MRLLQISIPSGKRDRLQSALDEEGLDYIVTDETSERAYDAIVYIPLPTNAVEPTLETLRNSGLDDDNFAVVTEAKTVVSEHFEELEAKYAAEEDEDRIARDELITSADKLAPSFRTYVIMTVVSAVIATAGLLMDSPAVVVGSMVIAPLIGPAMAASVGTVVNEREMFRRGIRLQVIGLGVSVAAAFVFAFLVKQANLIPPLADVTVVPEIRERVAPDFLSLAIALGAGVAGIVSLTSGVSAGLVGVMIAVALIPPAATVGIGLAWGEPMVSLGAGVLLLVNVLSINLAALAVLWYMGYRPEQWFRQSVARRTTIKRIGTLVIAIVVLSLFLGGVTLDSYQRATTETDIQADADAVIESYDTPHEVELLDVEVTYQRALPLQDPQRVIITVGVPPGESVSGLADAIGQRVRETAGTDVTVEVRYVGAERTRT